MLMTMVLSKIPTLIIIPLKMLYVFEPEVPKIDRMKVKYSSSTKVHVQVLYGGYNFWGYQYS